MRFKATPKMMNDKLETFTIEINNVTPASCSIDLVWDKTLVSIPVTTSVDEKIMKQIDKELAADKRPYYSAANYYFENGKDINKAAEWINKAVENNPNAYWMWQVKAKIFMKMNNKAEALKAAETSLAKAREDKNDEFVVSNEKLITEIKAMK
jgi:tetratricopeptide (TPR) repeat protein